jgi:hypothetical protein
VKVTFSLEEGAPFAFATESVWARPVENGAFVVQNVPFFVYGVSCGDQVNATQEAEGQFRFSKPAGEGGHSTYRAFLAEATSPATADEYWRRLESLGCQRELASARYWAIDLGPDVDIYRVYAVLQQGESDGVWSFEEAHVGHPLRPDDRERA